MGIVIGAYKSRATSKMGQALEQDNASTSSPGRCDIEVSKRGGKLDDLARNGID